MRKGKELRVGKGGRVDGRNGGRDEGGEGLRVGKRVKG